MTTPANDPPDDAETPDEPHGPTLRKVSRFEQDVIRIARFIYGAIPFEQISPIFQTKSTPPPCLSRNCVELVQDTLSKGTILRLIRMGGWRPDSYLRGNQIVKQRVWDRFALRERSLAFSDQPLAFLRWIATEPQNKLSTGWDYGDTQFTPADQLFFAFVLDAFRPDPTRYEVFRHLKPFANNPFCWLLRPSDFVGPTPATVPSLRTLFSGVGLMIFESLQPHLAQQWLTTERLKLQQTDWTLMRQEGECEFNFLSQLLDDAAIAKRTDLARFLLRVLSRIREANPTSIEFWCGNLRINSPPRLADRIATQTAALALLRQAPMFANWDQRARSIGYFDDDYGTSQLWKEDYEALGGATLNELATLVLRQLQPLQT